MKAVLWDGGVLPECLSLSEIDKPEVRDDWVVVKNQIGGICGSDLHLLLGETSHVIDKKRLPAAIGHEVAGVVEEVGKGVTHVKEGDRVSLEINFGCHEQGIEPCDMCKIGLIHLCENLAVLGVPTTDLIIPGGYAEYSAAHKNNVFLLPENVSPEEGVTVEPLAVGVRAVNRSSHNIGDDIAVMGCGMIGLDLIQVLRASGCGEIYATAKYRFQAEAARRLGADEVVVLDDGTDPVSEILGLRNGKGVDRAFECVGGKSKALSQAISLTRPGGKVFLLGLYPGDVPVDLLSLILKEITLDTSNCYTYGAGSVKKEFQAAIDLIAKGRVTRKQLITHTFRIEEYRRALDVATHKGREKAIKVIFDYR